MAACVCEVCGQGPAHGVTVYRTAPKGQAPHWRCQFHMADEQRPDKELASLIALIESDGAEVH
jgi:hypothetical protein